MRPRHLLLLVLFGLLFGLGFANPAIAQSKADALTQTPMFNSNKTPSFNFSGKNLLDKPTNGLTSGFRVPYSDSAWDIRKIKGLQMHQDPVCYAMRTYRVARVDRDSDVVEPSGYTTCQPGSIYSVKSAVEQVPSPSR